MEIFEKASRLKLRFEYKGLLSVEDLWDLSDENLDTLFKLLNTQLEKLKGKSLLSKPTKETEVVSLKVAIIKHVFDVKQAEKEASKAAAEKRIEKGKILEAIETLEKQELMETPLAKLKKRAAKLG